MGYVQEDWHEHYASGKSFAALRDGERVLLAEHAPAPEDGRALDVGCGTGELAVHLESLGYRVDACDFAPSALERAREGHPGAGVRWLSLDVEHEDLAPLSEDGYDLVVLRLVAAFLKSRTRVLRALAERLRLGGTLVIITPLAENTSEERRNIALDAAEIGLITAGWEHAEQHLADDLAFLVLRGPQQTPVLYAEKGVPKPVAMAGVAAVVTNPHGQVLLGWNPVKDLWELPAGKVEPGEPFEATAVRELEEEAGLVAAPGSVLLLGTLCDATAGGSTRITEIARITAYTGEPTVQEGEQVTRWEWHTPSDLRTLPQPVFTASAQALNAAWPGLLPNVPAAHHTPRPAGTVALAFGEPPEAVRLREDLVRGLTEDGWTNTPVLRGAFRAVARQAYLPEQPLARAYANEAVATVFDEATGRSMSSVSQPEMQALMLREAGLRPGDRVLEIGGGGYNACLAAEVVGPTGSVVCIEIDPYVHARTERFLVETGYADRVRAVLGDGALGAPGPLVPEGGFDAILVTVGSNEIEAAWREQLAEGRTLVVPLRIGGFTRAVGLRKQSGILTSGGISVCGFVPMQGAGRWDETPEPIGESGYAIRWEDTAPASLKGLDRALATAGVEVRTGVRVVENESFEDLQLWLATSVAGFCRLTGDRESPGPLRLPKSTDAMAMVSDGSLACVVIERLAGDEDGVTPTWEFCVRGFGADGKTAADTLARAVHVWDRDLRGRATPALTILPAGTPDSALPAGDVVEKRQARIVTHWPGRDGATALGVEQDTEGGTGR